ncbi:MAG: DUF6443 domain-containing protein [Bacteroidota bacterium]
MKRHKLTFSLLITSFIFFPEVLRSQPARIAPLAYSGSVKVNYVRSWDVFAPETGVNALLTRPVSDVLQTTGYSDGLGRPVQTVVRRGSLITGGTPTDLVTSIVYDEFGREVYKYLPFAANTTGGNTSVSDGFFKLNPFQQDSAFNKGLYPEETFYYSKTEYEPSPLNRMEKGMAPVIIG